MSDYIRLNKIYKFFGTAKKPYRALGPIDLRIQKGSYNLIYGRSGSGKSTLLNILSGLDKATSGQTIIEGMDLSNASDKYLAGYRARNAIIFQAYNLLPNLNVLENVYLGCWLAGKKVSYQEAAWYVEKFDLAHKMYADVKFLSGGEKQRLAICRAVIREPDIMFCDEPTGALDSQNEHKVQSILADLHNSGMTIILVTHNPEFKKYADQIFSLDDGILVSNQIVNKEYVF